MKTEDPNQRNFLVKLLDSSKDPVEKEPKKQGSVLTNLIFIVCFSIIGYIGISFASCNFMLPGTIIRANVLGGLKNPPPLDCKESERRGYETLLTVLTTVIALKTKVK